MDEIKKKKYIFFFSKTKRSYIRAQEFEFYFFDGEKKGGKREIETHEKNENLPKTEQQKIGSTCVIRILFSFFSRNKIRGEKFST